LFEVLKNEHYYREAASALAGLNLDSTSRCAGAGQGGTQQKQRAPRTHTSAEKRTLGQGSACRGALLDGHACGGCVCRGGGGWCRVYQPSEKAEIYIKVAETFLHADEAVRHLLAFVAVSHTCMRTRHTHARTVYAHGCMLVCGALCVFAPPAPQHLLPHARGPSFSSTTAGGRGGLREPRVAHDGARDGLDGAAALPRHVREGDGR
jgi:hypothetical protein